MNRIRSEPRRRSPAGRRRGIDRYNREAQEGTCIRREIGRIRLRFICIALFPFQRAFYDISECIRHTRVNFESIRSFWKQHKRDRVDFVLEFDRRLGLRLSMIWSVWLWSESNASIQFTVCRLEKCATIKSSTETIRTLFYAILYWGGLPTDYWWIRLWLCVVICLISDRLISHHSENAKSRRFGVDSGRI